MKKGGKLLLAALGIGTVSKLIYDASKKVEAEGYSAHVVVAFGGVGESVLEGQSIPLTVTIKNTSAQGGVAVAASLTTKISVKTTDGTVALAENTKTDSYAASGTKTYSYTLTAPLGKGGQSLGASVNVYDPNGIFIMNGAANQLIISIAIKVDIVSLIFTYAPHGTSMATGTWPAWLTAAGNPTVPSGNDVVFAFSWVNSSNIPVTGLPNMKVVYPAGGAIANLGVYAGGSSQNVSVNGKSATITFNSFNASESGTYTMTATVKDSSGNVLASILFPMTVAVPIPVTPPTVQTTGASTITGNSAILTGSVLAVGVPPPGYGGFTIIGYGKVNKAGTVDWDLWTPWQDDRLGYHDWVVTGLDPGSVYYFEMIGNIGGTTPKLYSFGGMKSFQTTSPIIYGATVTIG